MKSRLLLFAVAALLCAASHAQSFPQQRPITLVVPFAPGGGTDSISRELAKHLQDKLGTAVIVDNRGGAGGAIAAAQVNKAINDAAATEELRTRFDNEGADPFSGTPGDFANVLKDELERGRRVVREGGLKLD